MQRATPPDGGVIERGFEPQALFYSPSGVVEPHLPRAVARLAQLLALAGFTAGDRVLNGFSYHFTPAGLLFHDALVHLGCCALPIGPQNLQLQAEFALRARANAFVGVASHLRLLLDSEGAGDLKITVAMAGAEPLAQSIRDDLMQRHGVRCADMYGFAEAGIIATGGGANGVLELHEDVVAEILDPQTLERLPDGGAGEFVVSLDNPGFPLLRFATGDLARLLPREDGDERGRRMVLLGRTGHSVRVKGMLLHEAQLRDFAQRAGVGACRVSVSRDGRGLDRISVAVGAPAPGSEEEMLQAFYGACRLKASGVQVNADVESGTFMIRDERNGESAP
jgi:phenylacetate-CoA ligase